MNPMFIFSYFIYWKKNSNRIWNYFRFQLLLLVLDTYIYLNLPSFSGQLKYNFDRKNSDFKRPYGLTV